MKRRITEEFVKYHRRLAELTGDNPGAIEQALDTYPELEQVIGELVSIWSHLNWHRKTAKDRFIVQAHPEFRDSFANYERRWTGSFNALIDWRAKKEGQPTIEEIVADVSIKESDIEDDYWDLNPDWHSAAEHISLVRENIEGRVDYEPFYSRAKGAFDWLTNTVGIDLAAMEERWREFPVITVPQHVSDAHGLTEPQSLYGYLTETRLAYTAGAFLAALSMCRTVTEILIREHYTGVKGGNLSKLIEKMEAVPEFEFVKFYNIGAKVTEANKIIHSNKDDIRHPERLRVLIKDWVNVLQEMIARAPQTPKRP